MVAFDAGIDYHYLKNHNNNNNVPVGRFSILSSFQKPLIAFFILVVVACVSRRQEMLSLVRYCAFPLCRCRPKGRKKTGRSGVTERSQPPLVSRRGRYRGRAISIRPPVRLRWQPIMKHEAQRIGPKNVISQLISRMYGRQLGITSPSASSIYLV